MNDFPCAGLRWSIAFAAGQNEVKAIARAANGTVLEDGVCFRYETEPWGAPARLLVKSRTSQGDHVLVQAELVDANGKRCLDSREVVRFSISGEGELLDNLGTTTGSRVVELANGRTEICVRLRKDAVVGSSAEGVAPAVLRVTKG